MASLVIVSVLVVLMALITVGFSRIMNRAVTKSVNNQLGSAALYAAQSGINDAMAYIKGQPDPGDVSFNDCTSMLKEPGMSNVADLSGDGNTKITCLMVNPTPPDLMYQNLAPNGSQVIKATTSDTVDKMMFSWQASNGVNTALPGSTSFSDVPAWNCPDQSGTPDCTKGNVPVLRVTLYPVPSGGKISGIESASKTFFLVPNNGGSGQIQPINYSTADGSVLPVNCNARDSGISGFSADYTCNAIIDGLYAPIEPDSYYYLTITPIYNQADVKIKATNVQKQPVNFINVQTVIDSTAKANNASKRLQERVDSNSEGDNISPADDAAPGYAIRSAMALCKQLELHKSYYNYIINKAPATCSGIPTVQPKLTLSITGNNGQDSGVTRDSETATPAGSGYSGVVYINSAATVNWKSTDAATSCMASGGWNGDQNPSSTWSGVTGSGSAPFTGITNYTTYSLTCTGPGGGTTPPTKTVTAWPPPQVKFSGPDTFHAGDSYTISWTSYNASKCTVSSTGNTDWNQTYTGLNPVKDGASQTFGSNWNDHFTETYSITCWDPVGRSASDTWQVSDKGGDTTRVAPDCTAKASFSGTDTSNAKLTYSTSCPASDPYNSGTTRYIWNPYDPTGQGYSVVPNGGGASCPPGTGPASAIWCGSSPADGISITKAGTYDFKIVVWAPGWGNQNQPIASADTGPFTVSPNLTVKITSVTGPYRGSGAPCWDNDTNHDWNYCIKYTSGEGSSGTDSYTGKCLIYWRGKDGSKSSAGPFATKSSGAGTSYGFVYGYSPPGGYFYAQCTDTTYKVTSSPSNQWQVTGVSP